MKDFKAFIFEKAQDKAIVNAIAIIVEPTFAQTDPVQIQLNIAQAVKGILLLFKEFKENRMDIMSKIKKMQSKASSNLGVVDKSTLDYSAAMNLLVLKLESNTECLKTKKAIESAYAYVASVCVNLERQCFPQDLDTVLKSSFSNK